MEAWKILSGASKEESRFAEGLFGWISQVVSEKRGLLIHMARKEGLDTEDALEVVQDALITLFEMPQGRILAEDSDDVAKLLVVIVQNAARNRRRRHYLVKEHDAAPEVLEKLSSSEESVDELVAAAERHVTLLGCLAKLKELQYHVVRLRLLEDKTGDEVSKILDISADHVAVLLHRAKKSIKACLLS
jgi:RNA polymerase sigma-70 factor (ECF subfamily)